MNNISLLRKKLLYRSSHRGCKETDIILGAFALKFINSFSFSELIRYEKIVDLDDDILYFYINHYASLPTHLDRGMIRAIIHFVVENIH
ncbi:succinate dehydrogenase assembly factor 2 [Wolbachia endosymbiont of Howardula sp.]|uniref:succinate dehydrogenase assembly factor 2 n=1 Tax=Wolbachia endosymbiont of Howardula sp. TaxID=2916816 RepID=UPI00217D74B9|nr:succinate dehydrogenase assembly factor 2 [Wolbachia endosymbiont of Howardula sp.]UWI83245.1 succinate dehydrogenase assembly factor 2 [Wolbachia endosymbiont of Howardula sp.]